MQRGLDSGGADGVGVRIGDVGGVLLGKGEQVGVAFVKDKLKLGIAEELDPLVGAKVWEARHVGGDRVEPVVEHDVIVRNNSACSRVQ